jgi:predicted nucleic acid-binding protein
MSRYVVDTSFLSSFFNAKDSNHRKALDFTGTMNNEYLIIPSVVIAEVSSFTQNRNLRDAMLSNVFNLASEIFPLDEGNIFDYLVFQESFPNNLTAIDSVVLFSALARDADLLTFDKKLKKKYEMVCENFF